MIVFDNLILHPYYRTIQSYAVWTLDFVLSVILNLEVLYPLFFTCIEGGEEEKEDALLLLSLNEVK